MSVRGSPAHPILELRRITNDKNIIKELIRFALDGSPVTFRIKINDEITFIRRLLDNKFLKNSKDRKTYEFTF